MEERPREKKVVFTTLKETSEELPNGLTKETREEKKVTLHKRSTTPDRGKA